MSQNLVFCDGLLVCSLFKQADVIKTPHKIAVSKPE